MLVYHYYTVIGLAALYYLAVLYCELNALSHFIIGRSLKFNESICTVLNCNDGLLGSRDPYECIADAVESLAACTDLELTVLEGYCPAIGGLTCQCELSALNFTSCNVVYLIDVYLC